jgi:hypothetical protein
MPIIISRPLLEDVSVTDVAGQMRKSPPRANRNTAGASPAVTDDPLTTFVPVPASRTEPRTLASEAKSSPTTLLFCARTITLPPRIPATTIHEQTFMLLQDNPSAAVLFRAAVFSPAIQAGYEDVGRRTAH